MRDYLTKKSWIEYDKLPQHLEFTLFHYGILWKMRPKKTKKFEMFGKECEMKRLQQVYGQDYMFSGKLHESKPIPVIFTCLIEYFNKKYSRNYNMILVNWYRDGNDNIGFHADDEKQIKPESEIITISLGVERDFVIKNSKIKKSIIMEHNSFLTMGGNCQKELKHSVPTRKNITKERISITLREFI